MKKRAFLFSLFRSILAVIISLFIFEVIGNKLLGDKNWLKDIDHRLQPNGKDINNDGIRCQFSADHFHPEDFNIIFLGDSFVFGSLLPADQAFPQEFEKKARAFYPQKHINVANFGWVSSSPLLSYRLLKDLGKKYYPDAVILCIDMTDFHDDIKYGQLLGGKGIYRLRPICPILLITVKNILKILKLEAMDNRLFGLFAFERFFITQRPLTETRPYFSYLQKNIEDINKFCKEELQAKFILMILPRSYQYSDRECPNNWEKNEYVPLGPYVYEPFKYFESIKKEAVYPIYSLLADFQNTKVFPTCFDNDPHWNENGHSVAAEAVFNYCLDADLFR